jgi:hypothetical protein
MTRVSDDIVEQVRGRVQVSDVVREIGGVALRRQGREMIGLCPFHADRKPSMTVNDGKGLFKCFPCGAGGDAFAFVMRLEGLDFPGAVARIAPLYGIDAAAVPASRLSPAEQAARRAALESRRGALAVLRALGDAAELKGVLALADKIWTAADAPAELALRYLATRGVRLRGLPAMMRAHRALWHAEARQSFPALVTRLEGPYGFHGVHRTFLAPDGGGKAPVEQAKMTLGSVFETGACARLQTAGERVALVEGLENALIFAQALHRSARSAAASASDPAPLAWPVWSVLALEGFRRVVLPDHVRTVLIVPDADESDRGAAEAIVQQGIARFQAQGRTVYRFNTPEGHDLETMRHLPAVEPAFCELREA